VSALTAGLFGKLPAHGDFVRRGWPADTFEALDHWLSAGLAHWRDALGEEAADAHWGEAPAWSGIIPAGLAGGSALYLALAPSVDRVGRRFFLAAGMAGSDAAVAGHLAGDAAFAQRLDEAVYAGVAGTLDADGLVAAIAIDGQGDEAQPVAGVRWWPLGTPASEPPVLSAATLDVALVGRLLDEGTP